jgi:hypothetical protein
MELAITSTVDPYFRFNGNLVYRPQSVEIEEAFATTTDLPLNLQARAGQFFTRFGRLNAVHPHAWDFVDQPFVMSKFMGADGNRGLGTEISWLVPLPWYAEVLTSITDATGESSARSFFGAQSMAVNGPLDLQSTTALKQFFPLNPDWSLAWGVSGATGPNPTGVTNRSDIVGTDLYLKYRPLEGASWTNIALTTEALARRRQVPGNLLADYGVYSTALWRFEERWAAAVRYEYGSGMPGDYLDPEWTGDRQRYTANVTFWPSEFSRLRLQGSVDRPAWLPTPTYAAFLAVEFVVGAHGAHAF